MERHNDNTPQNQGDRGMVIIDKYNAEVSHER